MADLDNRKQKDREEEKTEHKEFVRERILNKSEGRRRWLERAAVLLVSAVIFGVVSCMVFVWLKPHAEKWFKKEEPESAIYVPKDEETTAAPEKKPQETAEESGESTEEPTKNIEDVVESAVESYKWSVSDYEGLYRAVNEAAAQINKGIVTVTTRTQGTDWFDNVIETEGKASGVVWNITSSEMLILTTYQISENETTVEVTFNNGVRAAAYVKAADGKTGIAIVSVPLENVDELTRNSVVQVPLGNSLGVRTGQPVILAGSPKDYVGSVAYGMISYVRSNVQREDMDVRMLYTDVSTNNQATGFVLNLDGQIIGVITPKTTGTNTRAIGISDLKATIERLSNGAFMAYFGVVGQDVTVEISENYQIPRGIYVADATLEGPAYNGGLQSGDIITGIGNEEILTVKSLQSFLEEAEPGDVILVRAQRIGREGYTEIEFPVTLGVR